MLVLTGDIGGTKAHLALYALNDGTLALKRESIFLAKNYTRFEEIVSAFMGAEELTAACLGVAAPRYKGQIRMANLPWTFDASELAATLNVQKVHLLNDLEAHGYGIAQLLPENIFTLNPGTDGPEEPRANRGRNGTRYEFPDVERAPPCSASI
jgi:glucokinase